MHFFLLHPYSSAAVFAEVLSNVVRGFCSVVGVAVYVSPEDLSYLCRFTTMTDHLADSTGAVTRLSSIDRVLRGRRRRFFFRRRAVTVASTAGSQNGFLNRDRAF